MGGECGIRVTYVLFLDFAVETEIKSLLNVFCILGAAKGAESYVTLIAGTAVQVCVVDDIPLSQSKHQGGHLWERAEQTSFSPLLSPCCNTIW